MVALPAVERRSSWMLRLFARKRPAAIPLPSASKGGSWRSGWPSGPSSMTTSAPKSASRREHHAPEADVERSRTRMPASACVRYFSNPEPRHDRFYRMNGLATCPRRSALRDTNVNKGGPQLRSWSGVQSEVIHKGSLVNFARAAKQTGLRLIASEAAGNACPRSSADRAVVS